MAKEIVIEVPDEWLEVVGDARPEIWQDILRLGLHQYKLERALAMYRAGEGSLGYVAERVGIPKQALIRAARLQGIEPEFDEETVREELSR